MPAEVPIHRRRLLLGVSDIDSCTGIPEAMQWPIPAPGLKCSRDETRQIPRPRGLSGVALWAPLNDSGATLARRATSSVASCGKGQYGPAILPIVASVFLDGIDWAVRRDFIAL
jgi:hypothetical protein